MMIHYVDKLNGSPVSGYDFPFAGMIDIMTVLNSRLVHPIQPSWLIGLGITVFYQHGGPSGKSENGEKLARGGRGKDSSLG
jgi:hypothetical protein